MGVGVQHGAVGLVADGIQHQAFLHGGLCQQTQRLVAVYSHHHGIKALNLLITGRTAAVDVDTGRVAHDAPHWRGQTRVVHAAYQTLNILARTASDGEPLRPLAHLQQPVVVAKTNHGGDRKQQHLIGWAAPNAAQHRQKIPIAKRRAKAVLV